MKLIIGLGNPGSQYVDTRHNVGFAFLDCLANKYNIKVKKAECRAITGVGHIGGEEVVLAKPQTYMNASGESVCALLAKYRVTMEDCIILYDDVSLPLGRIRIRPQGSAGGHNGIKSILYLTKTDVFPRVKIGVGAPAFDLVDHVLGKFSKLELEQLIALIPTVCDAVETILVSGTQKAMNDFNHTGG